MSSEPEQRVAVLGAGHMGAGIVRSLRRTGHMVDVWDGHPAKAAALEAPGVRAKTTVAEATEHADVVVSILFDTASVLRVLDQARRHVSRDAIWLQSTTVGPDGMDEIGHRAATDHITMIDAPVLGSTGPAARGELVILVSGAAAPIRSVVRVTDALGSRTIIVGPTVGQASALKAVVNAWVLSVNAAVAQSVALCQRIGLDPDLFTNAIDHGPTDMAYARMRVHEMTSRSGPVSFTLDAAIKDAELIGQLAARSGVSTQFVDATRHLLESARDRLGGSADMASIIDAFT